MSRKYQEKPQHKHQTAIQAICAYCKNSFWETRCSHNRYKKHFCCINCYSSHMRIRPPEEHPRWQGGVNNTEAHRRWKAKNPERMAYLKARRYARERGAVGSHTFEEWNDLKAFHKQLCAICYQEKPLTKDHIVPLSENGTDYISNIQPLCRNCNSRKWKKFNIYEHPELLKSGD